MIYWRAQTSNIGLWKWLMSFCVMKEDHSWLSQCKWMTSCEPYISVRHKWTKMKSCKFSHAIKKLNMAAERLDSTMTFTLCVWLIWSHIVANITSVPHYYRFPLSNFTGMSPHFHHLAWQFISRVFVAALTHTVSLFCISFNPSYLILNLKNKPLDERQPLNWDLH